MTPGAGRFDVLLVWPLDRLSREGIEATLALLRRFRETTLGALLVLMVTETAQHAGHADIVRELIDGTGGPDQDALDEPAWGEYTGRIQTAANAFVTDPEMQPQPEPPG